MKAWYWIVIVGLLCGAAGFYIWYAHASIYWKLGAAGVTEPPNVHSYTLGPASGKPLTYAAIGDSLTAGVGVTNYTHSYPYDIAAKLASSTGDQVTLTPYAVPGVRTQYVIDHFLKPVITERPNVITLFIGINDIHGHVSNATFKQHYQQILAELTQGTHAKIYVINLPYIGTPQLIGPLFRWYFNWRTTQYNTIIKQLATQYGVTYVDLYHAHQPHELDPQYYARDHFHQNAFGYTLWAHDIYASIHQ